jgi:hypothetical protein
LLNDIGPSEGIVVRLDKINDNRAIGRPEHAVRDFHYPREGVRIANRADAFRAVPAKCAKVLFSERLEAAIVRYHANAITTAEVLEELIRLAKDIQAARSRRRNGPQRRRNRFLRRIGGKRQRAAGHGRASTAGNSP